MSCYLWDTQSQCRPTWPHITGGSRDEEFIAAITQHIPEKSFQLVRYYGWYSNRTRGDRRLGERQATDAVLPTGENIISIADYEPRRLPSPKWRECIKKVWEVDPLSCPHCQGEMRIVSFITDYPVIRSILKHLDLWDRSPPDPKRTPAHEELVYEPFDDGWPGYEEPVVVAQEPGRGCGGRLSGFSGRFHLVFVVET